MIALVDYGAGNLASVRKALVASGADVFVPSSPADLARASGVVVPGVGHFERTAALSDGWRQEILAGAAAGRPLLGICLGMQWLFEGSDEDPSGRGLGIFPGRCLKLTVNRPLKVPHVGWNQLEAAGPSRLFEGATAGAYVYFTHGYAAPPGSGTVARTEHGVAFAAAVERGAVFGVQFHPEKSGIAGRRLLENFVRLAHAG